MALKPQLLSHLEQLFTTLQCVHRMDHQPLLIHLVAHLLKQVHLLQTQEPLFNHLQALHRRLLEVLPLNQLNLNRNHHNLVVHHRRPLVAHLHLLNRYKVRLLEALRNQFNLLVRHQPPLAAFPLNQARLDHQQLLRQFLVAP